MSDLLSIGATGVRAYQTALTTTSENIANAGTAGYAKRAANIRELSAMGGRDSASVAGMGATVIGIGRSSDMWRVAQVRTAGADLAKSEASVTWLQRIEDSLSGNKLGDRLTAFFNSATAVAADPSATAPRAAMLEAATTLATSFTATGAALDAAAADLDANAEAGVTELNNLAAALAKVNGGISRAPVGTSGQANLLDERDRLLESMSALIDADVSFDTTGRATVRMGGATGPVLISGEEAGTVTFVRNAELAVSFAVHRDGEASVVAPHAGALAGIQESAERIAAAKTDLDNLATAFVNGTNAVQAGGDDLFGAAGQPMFAVGSSPSEMSVVLNDPRGIAAAARGGGMRDNGNLANLAALRTSGGFETKVTDMVTTNASALSGRQAVADAQGSIRDTAVAARDAVSGVNLDEEAVNLLRFQQAYQASSRVIQVARETLQTLLDIR